MKKLGKYTDRFVELGISLEEAGNYMDKFRGKIVTVKAGGGVVEGNSNHLAEDLTISQYYGIKLALVHGGKERIDKLMKERKIKTKTEGGLRFTTPKILEIADYALGKINEEFVSKIGKYGGKAAGLTMVIKALKYVPDTGLVGEPIGISGEIMSKINEGYIAVISPISKGLDGAEKYNTNADDAGRFVSVALDSEKFIIMTNTDGIIINNQLVSKATPQQIGEWIKDGFISGGMIPKVKAAIKAKSERVRDVHVINGTRDHALLYELFTDKGIGTMITD